MRTEQLWTRYARKRASAEARRDRVNRNWCFHAERIAVVFNDFAKAAQADGVRVFVELPDCIIPRESTRGAISYGERPIGTSTVALRLETRHTGEGVITRSAEGESWELDLELGARLVIHYSEAEGLVQVFFEEPRLRSEERREPLLIDHTYNTDDVTREWALGLVSRFLVFNRFSSRLEDSGWMDSARVRWWRFKDIRNRRGYLNNFQHLLTPWELVLLTTLVAIPSFAVVQWGWAAVSGEPVVSKQVSIQWTDSEHPRPVKNLTKPDIPALWDSIRGTPHE